LFPEEAAPLLTLLAIKSKDFFTFLNLPTTSLES
jgi:hypothetical protein